MAKHGSAWELPDDVKLNVLARSAEAVDKQKAFFKKLNELYGNTTDDTPGTIHTLAPNYLLLLKIKDYLNLKSNQDQFLPQQYDALLNQASSLLEKCSLAKTEVDNMWISHAELQLQFLIDAHMVELGAIERQTMSALHDDLSSERAREATVLAGFHDAENTFSVSPETRNLTRKSQFESSLEAAADLAADTPGATQTKRATAAAIINRNSVIKSYFDERARIWQRSKTILREADLFPLKTDALERAKAVRQRRSEFAMQGGPLDYEDKITKECDLLIAPLFYDAYQRCETALIGLRDILQLSDQECPEIPPIPEPILRPKQGKTNHDPIFRLSDWVRKAIRAVLIKTAREIIVNLSVEVNVDGSGEGAFVIPQENLERYKNVRLRAIGATSNSEHTLSVLLSLPISAKYSTAGTLVTQARLNTANADPYEIFLGTVRPSSSSRPLDFASNYLVRNLAILGGNEAKWKISILPRSANIINIELVLAAYD